jgi:hypothetical protein
VLVLHQQDESIRYFQLSRFFSRPLPHLAIQRVDAALNGVSWNQSIAGELAGVGIDWSLAGLDRKAPRIWIVARMPAFRVTVELKGLSL